MAPRVRVVDASVVESTAEASVVSFLLELENPNTQPLPLREFTYTLSVGGKPALSSRRAAQATVPQQSSYTMLLPVVVPYETYGDVPSGVLPCVLSGQLTYVAPTVLGEVLFDMEIRVPKVGFTGAQDVDFSARRADASP